jgi:peptidoglycan/xylan/chitin deacetylase (PgdA/CDA1 family)
VTGAGRGIPGRLGLCALALLGSRCIISHGAATPSGVPSTPTTSLAATPPGFQRIVAPSGLPIPATAGVARPAGAPGNLRVLDWAGFKAAVSWTFDDSQPSHLAHYAELQAVGVPLTFYVNPGHDPGPYETAWTQAIKDGHELGNHSFHHCHADLKGCLFGAPPATLGEEIDLCSTYLTAHTPQTGVWTAASPFGDEGYDGADAQRFLVNRGVRGGTIGPNDHTDPFNLPTHLASTGETAARFNQMTDGTRQDGKWIIFLIHTIQPTDAVWYNPVSISELTGAMTHAKALPDVWTDAVVAIASYWRGQKLLSSTTPVTTGSNSTWTWTLPPHFPPGKFLRVTVAGGTLAQRGAPIPWNEHGYYEVALDAGALTLSP